MAQSSESTTAAVTTVPVPAETDPLVVANTVVTVQPILTTALDIAPMPPDRVPQLSVDDVLAVLQRGEFAPFFQTQSDLADVSITVGIVTQHGGTPRTDDPSFPGYFVEGGRSTCIWSGPEPANPPPTMPMRESACHAFLVINGDTGEIPTSGQIGD